MDNRGKQNNEALMSLIKSSDLRMSLKKHFYFGESASAGESERSARANAGAYSTQSTRISPKPNTYKLNNKLDIQNIR